MKMARAILRGSFPLIGKNLFRNSGRSDTVCVTGVTLFNTAR